MLNAQTLARRALQPRRLLTHHWQPYAWQQAALDDSAFIVLMTGSAGGGKSRTAGEKMHDYMRRYPNATGLMLRKAREFASKSIVPFMKQTVIGHEAAFKKSDSLFAYPNGSTLFWGGMKDDEQRESLRSIGSDGSLDIVWIEEANAFTEDDFNELLGRMRGKAGPYRQIILTTNPDAPNHWINRRLIVGREASVHYSGAKDNPANPPEYIENLNRMTGTLYDRLVLGRWIQAEGVVYDNFTVEHNVTEAAEYDPALDVYWGVDDGYALGHGPGHESYHPRVILMAQYTPIGGIQIFNEYYRTGVASYQDTIDEVITLPYARPEAVHIDSSAAMFKGALWEADLYTVGMTHKVSEGIKNLRQLICDGAGVRRFHIHPRCQNLIREMLSYRYSENMTAMNGEPKPMKLDDHGVDAARYLVWPLRNAA